ncbi:uncharacterized protein SAPINGB_P006432 [Magnusiomyces paraingens]|uniref:Cytokinin riboside 5'-monophosphate phosphoribohydrolase n=1 Tax=Magnusiomyces paraingens TaxID=2606893 RepID=A0A5E8C620_9ASCO|nr:uncharacterized protein SAPINGB_P006432 [Saprochaete ingens]VVT58883.1 unnamed protein product [Saprochaete ingens]
MTTSEIKVDKKICIFCGSSSGNSPAYAAAADALGKLLVEKNWGLVYGGGTTGVMGDIAKAVGTRGGYVHGIIPKALIEREQGQVIPDPSIYGHTTLVDDMHTRKRLMGRSSDAFVAMPGGYGTAEELFEVITWNQLGIHSLPVVIFNIEGFYDGLVEWINTAVGSGFISKGNRDIIVVASTPEEVIEKIENYKIADGRLNLNWDVQTPGIKEEHTAK